ncbi:MAG: phosphatidate cytidylyltransferase [Planctomycetota bacterium]
MKAQRIIIALVNFALAGGLVFIDWNLGSHLATFTAMCVVGVLAQAEIYPMFRRMGLDSEAPYGVVAALVLLLWRGLGGYTGLTPAEVQAIGAFLLVVVVVTPLIAVMLRVGPRLPGAREDFERIAVTLFGLLVVWFLLSFLLELRMLDNGDGSYRFGLKAALLLVLSVKLGDSAAYVVGRSFGVTPLTWVSPKKTWEGAGASVAAAVLISVVLGVLLGFTWWHMVLFGILTNVAGQFGDLLESLIKRRSGVKDSGRIFKEMGGFLDLVDSLLLAAPVGYLFVRIVVL